MSDWLDAEGHADRAFEMFERGKWAEAEAELRQAISLNPDHPEWHMNLGLTLEHAGREADALDCYERAVDLMPEHADPLLAASALANRLGQCRKAIKWLDRAIRIEPLYEEAYVYKIESHTRLGDHDSAETTFYLAQHALDEPSAQCFAAMAESLIQRQLYERAEWCLKEALKQEPQMPRLRARLASVLATMGRSQRALQLYVRELRDDPGNIETLLEYGNLLQEMGRFPEAAEKYRRVLELEPANVNAHFALGEIAAAALRFDQAGLEFELVLKLDPQFPGIRSAIALTLLQRHRRLEARRYLLEEFALVKAVLTEQSPDDANLESTRVLPRSHFVDVAGFLLEVDEPARAAELFELVLRDGEEVDLLRQLALAKFRMGDRDGGAAVSRRVLRLDRGCIRSIHNLAFNALQQNRLRVAGGWIRRGLSINRHDDGLRRLRIRLWMAMGRSIIVGLWSRRS